MTTIQTNRDKKPTLSPTEEDIEIAHESCDRTLQQIHRQADLKILLWYSFVYLLMRIDVTNISNTAIINIEEGNGIKKELGNVSSGQWAWALSIF